MSSYSGRRLNFDVTSGPMDGNDCDCEVDGSFIIIPKQESISVVSPSSNSNNEQSNSTNVEEDQAVAGCATATTSVPDLKQLTSAVDSSSNAGDAAAASMLSLPSKTGEATENESRSMQWSQLNTSVNSNSSIGSEASSLEEANAMLNSINIENQKLKLLLAERNENMKRSLDTYKNLQISMSVIHEDHKTKYEGSRTLIEQLREENAKLRSELDVKEAKFQEYSNNLNTATNTEFEKLNMVVEKLHDELNSKQTDLDSVNRQLKEQLKLVLEADSQREQLNELLRKTEIELVGAKSSGINKSAYSDLQKQRDTLHAAFEDSKIAIEELNKHRMKKDEEIKELTETVKASSTQIENLKQKLRLLIEEAEQSEVRYNGKLESIAELEAQLLLLGSNDKRLQEELNVSQNETVNLRNQLEKERNAFQQVKEALTDKEREVSLLLTQMAVFKSQEEQTELYKTQMEEYKTNFEEERRDRVSMKERKDQLADELTRLKLELEDKTAELESLHRAHLQLTKDHVDRANTSSPGRSSSSSAQQEENGGPPSRQISEDAEATISPCPLCHKKFSTRNALLSHASHCGDVRSPFLFP